MTTMEFGAKTRDKCICSKIGMSIIGDHERCACEAGLGFYNGGCSACPGMLDVI